MVVPLGEPIAGTRLYIDGKGPIGPGSAMAMEGELWIGGVGVARGYINRPDLTRQKFVSLLPPHRGGGGGGEQAYRWVGGWARGRGLGVSSSSSSCWLARDGMLDWLAVACRMVWWLWWSGRATWCDGPKAGWSMWAG